MKELILKQKFSLVHIFTLHYLIWVTLPNLVGTMLVQLEVKLLMFGARLSVRSVNFKNLKTLKTL